MTLMEMLNKMLENEDAYLWIAKDGTYHIDINDCESWETEDEREYTDAALVDAFFAALNAQTIRVEGDFYKTYYLADMTIQIGWTSYDL